MYLQLKTNALAFQSEFRFDTRSTSSSFPTSNINRNSVHKAVRHFLGSFRNSTTQHILQDCEWKGKAFKC